MGRKKLEPIVRPDAPKELAVKPSWDETYEEALVRSLFEEDEKIDKKQTSSSIINSNTWAHKERPNEEWDVPITEEIQYFDPDLSYEITGYRPITYTKGLDFDYHVFTKVGEKYNETGNYTEFPVGSKPYRDFWTGQRNLCSKGCTIGKYRIPGDYYFFLNFYRLPKVSEKEAASGSGRFEGFPNFSVEQYKVCHYLEMCEILHKDFCILKGRGVGLSELVACFAVRPYTTNKRYRTLLTCEAESKLTPLKEKCWTQLNWLDLNTQGGFKHLRQKINTADKKRASLVNKEGQEYGWMSEIDSIVADDPQKVRGDRCDRIIYEEAGSSKYLIKALIQGHSLTELGGKKMGTCIILGTGGDDQRLGGLADVFSNPIAYNVFPFKCYDTDDGKPQLTGFFLPSHKFSLLPEYIDARGFTDYNRFKEFYKKQRAKLTEKALIDECAEHCFTPREALIKHGDNVFDAVALSQRLMQVKIQNLGHKGQRTHLLWDKTVGTGTEKIVAVEDSNSKLIIYEPPQVDERGIPYSNLYVGGIDSIDMGTGDSATDYDVSDFCIVIKKRVLGMEEPRYVAIYKDRPSNIRIAYDVAMKLLTWYNCKAILEYTKISIIQYFTERGKSKLFMERPESVTTTSKNTQRRPTQKHLIGIPGTPAVIGHGIELITNYIADYWHTFDDEEMIEQLINYTIAEKRKFDIIAAMICAEIADEALYGVSPKIMQTLNNQWRDIGYYIDQNGIRRHGVIPKR